MSARAKKLRFPLGGAEHHQTLCLNKCAKNSGHYRFRNSFQGDWSITNPASLSPQKATQAHLIRAKPGADSQLWNPHLDMGAIQAW